MGGKKRHRWVRFSLKKRSTCSLSWVYCVCCGLVWLRNEASNIAAKKPCVDDAED